MAGTSGTDGEGRSRPARGGPGRALLVAAGTAGGLAAACLLELAAGLLLDQAAPTAGGRDSVALSLAWIDASPVPQVPDSDLLWRNRPGATRTRPVNPRPWGSDETWTLANDDEGFRIVEPSPRSEPKKAYRVLCVGDSVTFGFNTDQPFAYPRRLLELLRERWPGKDFEVINAGVPGWSWLQGLRFLELRAADLEPDVVVIGHGTNDQFFAAEVTDDERLGVLGSPLSRALGRIADAASRTNLAKLASRRTAPAGGRASRGCERQVAAHGSCRRVSVEQIEGAVARAADVAAAAGAELVVANTDFVRTASALAASRAANDGGIPFVDLVAGLDARKKAIDDAEAARAGLAPPGTALPPAPDAGRRIVLRVRVPDPSRTYGAAWRPYLSGVDRSVLPLADDGRGADETAGDGVFSAVVEMEATVAAIEYGYLVDGQPDFLPLPPVESSLSDRLLLTPAPAYGPVDTFGRSVFMAELVHPNRHGHEVIAGLVADAMAALPSFRRYVGNVAAAPSR